MSYYRPRTIGQIGTKQLGPKSRRLRAKNSFGAMTTSVLATRHASQNRLCARYAWQVSWLAGKVRQAEANRNRSPPLMHQRIFLAFPADHHEKADDS
ncbi:hypothetical protein [Rhizobium rhizogenes]|uniref:hypothetical protein n=1 Tax=Rhizobium rhizogenes TaxID=359 RepID=UPI00403FA3AB